MDMGSQVSSSRSRQREAWILAGMMFLITPSSSVVTPILPNLRSDFHLSVTGTALIISCFSLAQLVLDLPVGMLLDRLNHRRLLIGGILCVLLGSILSALAFSFPHLLLARLLSGAGASICITTTMFTFSRLGTIGTRGSLFGLNQAMALAGSSISPILSGWIASAIGWRAAFLFAGLAATLALVLTLVKKVGVPASQEQGPGSSLVGLLRETAMAKAARAQTVWGQVAPIYLIVFLILLTSSGFHHTALPIYASETLHLNASAIGWAVGIAMMMRSVANMVGGRLSDRYGHRLILVPGLVIVGLGFLTFNQVTSLRTFLGMILFTNLGYVGSALPDAWLIDLSSKSRWGTLLGISRFCADLGHVLGPVAFGWIFDHGGFSGTSLTSASLIWLAALVAGTLVREVSKPLSQG